MIDQSNSWKDSPDVFLRQLDLNRSHLEDWPQNIPQHWRNMQALVSENNSGTEIKKVFDLGCGCGVMYEVMKRFFPKFEYTGLDYSEKAIEIAKKTWSGNFIVKDLWDTEQWELFGEQSADVLLHCDALLDILNNGDEALEHVLGLNARHVLLNRVQNGPEPNHFTTYEAYGIVPTYSFYHNRERMIGTFKSAGYFYKEISNPPYSTFFLWRIPLH